MYWFNNQTEDKYFTYFYKTTDFSGEILTETEEGKAFWTSIDKLEGMKLAPNFKEYLPIFFKDTYTEAYCSWNDDMKPDLSMDIHGELFIDEISVEFLIDFDTN